MSGTQGRELVGVIFGGTEGTVTLYVYIYICLPPSDSSGSDFGVVVIAVVSLAAYAGCRRWSAGTDRTKIARVAKRALTPVLHAQKYLRFLAADRTTRAATNTTAERKVND